MTRFKTAWKRPSRSPSTAINTKRPRHVTAQSWEICRSFALPFESSLAITSELKHHMYHISFPLLLLWFYRPSCFVRILSQSVQYLSHNKPAEKHKDKHKQTLHQAIGQEWLSLRLQLPQLLISRGNLLLQFLLFLLDPGLFALEGVSRMLLLVLLSPDHLFLEKLFGCTIELLLFRGLQPFVCVRSNRYVWTTVSMQIPKTSTRIRLTAPIAECAPPIELARFP